MTEYECCKEWECSTANGPTDCSFLAVGPPHPDPLCLQATASGRQTGVSCRRLGGRANERWSPSPDAGWHHGDPHCQERSLRRLQVALCFGHVCPTYVHAFLLFSLIRAERNRCWPPRGECSWQMVGAGDTRPGRWLGVVPGAGLQSVTLDGWRFAGRGASGSATSSTSLEERAPRSRRSV